MTDPNSQQGYWGAMQPPPPRQAPPIDSPYAPNYGAPNYGAPPQGAPQPYFGQAGPAVSPQQPFVPSWQQQQSQVQRTQPRPVSFDRMADVWGAAVITVGVVLILLGMTVLSWVDTFIDVTFGDVHRVASYGDGPFLTTTYFDWGLILLFIVTTIGAYSVRVLGVPRGLGANLVAFVCFVAAAWTWLAIGLGANAINVIDVVGAGFWSTLIGFLLVALGTLQPRASH